MDDNVSVTISGYSHSSGCPLENIAEHDFPFGQYNNKEYIDE